MSRLYIILLFCGISISSLSQNELGKYLEFAQQQFEKGDFIYALTYYEKAMEIDSNSVAILWKYAETLRSYKDYQKARFYYSKVYDREEARIYPASLLNWALMEKQIGNYAKAVELLKEAKKKYAKDKKDYLYLKSKRELESCLWAQTALKDTANIQKVTLPDGLNTVNSEFGHSIRDNHFFLSSLRADSTGADEEIYDLNYTNKLYTFPWDSTNINPKPSLLRALSDHKINTGNGTFSLDGTRFYFSQCTGSEQQYNCQIAVVSYTNGKWGVPSLLGEIINEPGTNTTTPAIASINGEEWLLFSSNREDGKGGMDLYFSVIKNNGNQFSKVRPLNTANSLDNDLAPWFDPKDNRIYFSSQWWNGFGGYDIHYISLEQNGFSTPQNAGLPINSSANDLYYFKNGDSLFVSSNRLGVLHVKNPTCCSDIFAFTPPIVLKPVTKKETLADLNKRLPVTLYFHNDIPDPRSRETTTKVNYTDSYDDYLAMIPQYKKEYSKGLAGDKVTDAEEDIESFFTEYVEKGVSDLNLFKSLLIEELNKGFRIRLSVRGFASPLAKTEYNVALTQRRISSLVNHLMITNDGVFAPYLKGTAINGGMLEVVGVPFGEYTADQITSDNPNDLKNSVFSRAAAIERKIEIQSVSYIDTDSLFFLVDLEPTSLILGKRIRTDDVNMKFKLSNNGSKVLRFQKAVVADSAFSIQIPTQINAKETIIVSLTATKTLPIGIFSMPLDLYFEGYEKPVRIQILGEGM